MVHNGAVDGGESDSDVGGAGHVMDEILMNALSQSRSRINFVRTNWVFHDGQRRVLAHLFRHQQCRTGLDLAPRDAMQQR